MGISFEPRSGIGSIREFSTARQEQQILTDPGAEKRIAGCTRADVSAERLSPFLAQVTGRAHRKTVEKL